MSLTHGGSDNNLNIPLICDFSVTTNYQGPCNYAINRIKDELNDIQHYPKENYEPLMSKFKEFIYDNNKELFNKDRFIIFGNGASELIELVIKTNDFSNINIGVDDTQYLEYQRFCNLKLENEFYKVNNSKSNILIIINPNNPTGTYLNINQLKKFILENTVENSIVLVDESMQIWEGEKWTNNSLILQEEWINNLYETNNIKIFIIHSWTKIFSCTGLRIGSIICPTKDSYNNILKYKVPWNTNVLALKYLEYCIYDKQYLINTWDNTAKFRQNQINKIKEIFNDWDFYGEKFLSYIWINTFNENLSELCYNICKLRGLPIRHGKIGYNKNEYIRIAVREDKYFNELLEVFKYVNHTYNSFKNSLKQNIMHFDIPDNIIDRFDYFDIDRLLIHEDVLIERHSSLIDYFKSCDNIINIPAIIICNKTNTIIDGHHRLSVLKYFNFKKIPCLSINYYDDNIITNPYKTISKDTIINYSTNNKVLPPKSTCHMIRDKKGSLHSIIIISPIVCLTLQ